MIIRSIGLFVWLAGAFVPQLLLAQGTVAEHRFKWQAAAISDYEYRYEKVCECHRERPAEFFVTVREGAVIAVRHWREDIRQSTDIDSADFGWYRTVEDFFALIEAARDNGILVRASYHPQLGYPTRVFVDYDPIGVGEELDIRIINLETAS